MSKKSKLPKPKQQPLPPELMEAVQRSLDEAVARGEVLCRVVNGVKSYSLPEWQEVH